MKKLIFLLTTLILSGIISAQSGKDIPGIILDANGEVVKGVQFYITQSRKYVRPGKNGEFILKNVRPSDNIQVQVKKKRYAQFTPEKRTNLKLELSENELSLIGNNGEKTAFPLVAIKRSDKSGNLITADMIEGKSFRTLEDVLRGLAPTLQSHSGSNGTEIIMRGANSRHASSAALILVNNTEMSFDSANSISVHDIASIEINRTGSGYGLRGANGVIIIKTK